MTRARAVWLGAMAIELAALTAAASGHVAAFALLHAAAGLPILFHSPGPRSARFLAAALVLAVPLGGLALALLPLFHRSADRGAELLWAPPRESRHMTVEQAVELAEAPALCDALSSENPEVRSAALACLSRRADAESVHLLRWAHDRPDFALSLEAALALESLSAHQEAKLAACRSALALDHSAQSALTAAAACAELVESHLVEGALASSMTRSTLQQIDAMAPPDALGLHGLEIRARLQLAALDPDGALDTLGKAQALGAGGGEMEGLAADAAFAARRARATPLAPVRP